ncbi:protein translocase SEC61 complex subunit gamma [Candidatus Woesearchaeota archaeon]|nr:protein translocase SEC61 complex subunit gamma [Candidatus Woesearchaeota archaeon]MBW3022250.1 protein translocase SEC61 complex subunit gamma [Candidatus Woesearchaeota archaeon]
MEFQQQEEKQTAWSKIKRFWRECRRVLRVTRKPTNDEFKTIVKISGIGLAVIGVIGFAIAIIKQVFI